jgi:hypothetical protein
MKLITCFICFCFTCYLITCFDCMHAWWLKWYDWMIDSNRLMIHAHDRLHARDDINAYECCIMWLMFYHAIDRMHVCYCRCLLLVFTCFNDMEICNKTWHDWMTWKRLKLELKWLTARKTRRDLPRARRGIRDRNLENMNWAKARCALRGARRALRGFEMTDFLWWKPRCGLLWARRDFRAE